MASLSIVCVSDPKFSQSLSTSIYSILLQRQQVCLVSVAGRNLFRDVKQRCPKFSEEYSRVLFISAGAVDRAEIIDLLNSSLLRQFAVDEIGNNVEDLLAPFTREFFEPFRTKL